MGDRVILHSDINCCYASIEHLHHPELAGKPLAVGGDPEARHGIVLTADYIAKKYGVKTGMALWQAKQVCPDITFVSPRMDLYLRFSRMAHPDMGYRRIRDELDGHKGIHVNDKRVLRICRKYDIKSKIKWKPKSCTRGERNPDHIAKNYLHRDFHADKPNEKWLTDVSELQMRISYNKLQKLMIDNQMKRQDLMRAAEISSSVATKLNKNETVSLDVLMRICKVFHCDIGD